MTKIKLREPIKIDGKGVSEITLRRPKVRDRLIVERPNISDAEKEVQLIANLSELPIEAIEDLDLRDYAKIQKELSGFLLESAEKI
jgi:hypothetical protein